MKRVYWTGLAVSCFVGCSVLGAGYQLYTEGSAEALGQAGAISGRDDLTSLAWYNPAALAGVRKAAVMAGAVFVQVRTEFSGLAGSASMAEDWRMIPHAYFVQPVSSNWTALISVNAPYGLVTEWPDNWVGNLAATYSEFSAVYTTPSLACRMNDRLACAAGFNIVHAEAELAANRGVFGERTVQGDDLGCGYTVSAHGNIDPEWSVGARFQSRVMVKLQGDVDFDSNPLSPGDTSFSGSAEVELPSSVNIGLVNRSVERLRLGFDVIWTEWSRYDQLVYRFSSDYPALLDNPEVNSKRWKDVWSIRVGGEYELTDAWVVRGGYVWDESPVNNKTRSPELPDSDRQMVMIGIGWTQKNLSADMAYSYLWADKSRSGSEVVARVPSLNGTYDTVTHIVGLTLGYTF